MTSWKRLGNLENAIFYGNPAMAASLSDIRRRGNIGQHGTISKKYQ